MTFSYSTDLLTDKDRVRFYIGDTTSGSGPKPSGGNYSDEEIASLFEVEGSWQQVVAALFENLSTLYAGYVDTKVGSRDEKLSQLADNYAKQATQWRSYGLGNTVGFMQRVDLAP